MKRRDEDTGSGMEPSNRHGEDAGAGHSCCEHDGRSRGSGAGGCCGGGGGGGGCCQGESTGDAVFVFSRRQIRDLDRLAAEEFEMPTVLLMENAARGVASVILEGLAGIEGPTALILCGPGNNGGDGLAVARHLANRGVEVGVVLATPENTLTGDAGTNLRIVKKMGIPVFDASREPSSGVDEAIETIGDPVVIVDALLGTGVDRPVQGVLGDLITRVNEMKERGSTVVAIDVPSGLDCDTGAPAADGPGGEVGPAIHADLTIALAGVKAGFMTIEAQKYVGELVVVDIGAPRELVERLGRPLTAPRPD